MKTRGHTITVETRTHDYLAYIDGDKRLYESDARYDAVIGRLIMTHGKHLGVTVDNATKGKRPLSR